MVRTRILRGSHEVDQVNTSAGYRKLIVSFRMLQSMSRNANCWDAPIESFFKTLKVERVHQLRYETRAQARLDIVGWS
jgi:putative transposase